MRKTQPRPLAEVDTLIARAAARLGELRAAQRAADSAERERYARDLEKAVLALDRLFEEKRAAGAEPRRIRLRREQAYPGGIPRAVAGVFRDLPIDSGGEVALRGPGATPEAAVV